MDRCSKTTKSGYPVSKLVFQFNIPGDRTAAYGRQDPVEKKTFGKMLKERGFGDAIMKIAGVKQRVRLGLALIDDRYEEREGKAKGNGRAGAKLAPVQ